MAKMNVRIVLIAVTLLAATASTTTAQTIFDAITHGDIHLVREHIAGGTDVNGASELTGTRPLHYSAYRGHAGIVAALLQAGADPNLRTKSGELRTSDRGTALHLAADGGNIEIVVALLNAGANPSARDDSGWTPLHYAAFDGHAEIVTTLLEAGADATMKDRLGRTPIMINDQFKKLLAGSAYERLKRATN